jgi:hypothetical protein
MLLRFAEAQRLTRRRRSTQHRVLSTMPPPLSLALSPLVVVWPRPGFSGCGGFGCRRRPATTTWLLFSFRSFLVLCCNWTSLEKTKTKTKAKWQWQVFYGRQTVFRVALELKQAYNMRGHELESLKRKARWVLLAFRPAPTPPVVPSALRSSWRLETPTGPLGVSLSIPPMCRPPVPPVSVCGLLMYFKKYFLGKDFLKVLFVF